MGYEPELMTRASTASGKKLLTARRRLVLAAAVALGGHVIAQERTALVQTDALPSKALISGVPFFSWSDAAQLDYPNKNIANPSLIAVSVMQQKFWGLDPTKFNMFGPRAFVSVDWQARGVREGQDLLELKRLVAQGVPVEVRLTLTPFAHPLPMTAQLFDTFAPNNPSTDSAQAQDRRVQSPGSNRRSGKKASSGAMGSMATLEDLRERGVRIDGNKSRNKDAPSTEFIFLRESLYTASRLLIGYDDDRRVMTVHDPSFGPAMEIDYESFDAMWRYTGRLYGAGKPVDFESLQAKRASAAPYAARTPDMRAAHRFVTGYALAQVGRVGEAIDEFEKGLAISDVGAGYRFMLAFELAHLYVAEDKTASAIAALRSATDAVPQANAAWGKLAELYRQPPAMPDADRLAAEAEARAKGLSSDRSAFTAFVRAVPRDFFVEGLAPMRGWGFDNLGR